MLVLTEQIPRQTFDVTNPHLVMAAISAVAVVVSVLIHYEPASPSRSCRRAPRRMRIVALIRDVAHVIEIWMFGFLYWLSTPG